MTSRRWIAHRGHGSPPWEADLRRELVSAFRRGTMDAARCLRAYRLQGQGEMFPPEAVAFLAATAAADSDGEGFRLGPVTAAALSDQGETELADLLDGDRASFDGLVEAGRRFFYPGR